MSRRAPSCGGSSGGCRSRGLIHSSFVAYPTPRNLNYLWTFGAHPRVHAGGADRHRHRSGDALRRRMSTIAFNSVEQIMRDVNYRLAPALRALERRLDVLPRRLYPHVPRHVLRLLQGAARGALDPRRHPAAAHDHDRLHGLCAALGPDELLGGDRHHQPVLGDPAGRGIDRDLAVGRLCGRQSDAQPLLLRCTTCCRS